MKSLLLLLICLVYFAAFGQEKDSLKIIINTSEPKDTNKVHALVDLAAIHFHDNLDTSKLLIKEALIVARNQEYRIGEGFSNTAMSGYFFQKGDLDSALIYANIGAEILESTVDKQHVLASYNNMALIYNNMEKPTKAIEIYLKIFNLIKDKEPSIQHMAICNNLAVAYGNNGQLKDSKLWFQKVTNYAEVMQSPMGLVYGYNGAAGVNIELNELEYAIANSEKGLKISLETGMDKTAIESLQNLGKAYRKKGNFKRSNDYLVKGENLAEKIGSKRNLEVIYNELALNYESIGEFRSALKYNQNYHKIKDSIFAEGRVELIEELEKKYETAEFEKNEVQMKFEKEQLTKENELASIKAQKNRNYLLIAIGIIVLISIGGLLYIKQYKERKKAELAKIELEELSKRLKVENQYKDSELKAIKAQMNPHFMFNALNSIQDYIILNEKELASDYLGKFADLMRMYLDQSNRDLINIEDEMKSLHLYIELEALRQEGMEFSIKCESDTLLENRIPPMLIQPYVENAIKHGLWHRKDDKKLNVLFYNKEGVLNCEIIDNGIGITASKEININKGKHQSFSMNANENRLAIIQEKHGNSLSISVKEVIKNGRVLGTKVNIQIPFNLT